MPKWTGPLKGGITQSLLSKYLEDPYQFYLYAVLGLREPEKPEPNLIWGDVCHKGLELIVEKPYIMEEFTPEDWAGIYDGVEEHIHKQWPEAPITFLPSIKEMLTLYNDLYKQLYGPFIAEHKFNIPHTTTRGNQVTLRGKADGWNKENNILVEHKCKGRFDLIQTMRETPIDLQVNVYSFVLGTRTIIYDLIRIPDTQWSLPPKGQYQNPIQYIKSLYSTKEWGDFPIFIKKHKWIQQLVIQLNDEQVQHQIDTCINPLIDSLCDFWEYVNQSGFDHEDPKWYGPLFYKKPIRHFDPARTQSYKCSYWNYLTDTIDFDDLVPVNSFYAELDDDTGV